MVTVMGKVVELFPKPESAEKAYSDLISQQLISIATLRTTLELAEKQLETMEKFRKKPSK